MIQQPGNTDLSKEEVLGTFRDEFNIIFTFIELYHRKLGYPKTDSSKADKIKQHREFVLALGMELAELTEAVPWKPWRPIDYKDVDKLNIMEELIDLIFFIGSIRLLWDINPEDMADILERKLIENHRRISMGYNKPAEEMGNG